MKKKIVAFGQIRKMTFVNSETCWSRYNYGKLAQIVSGSFFFFFLILWPRIATAGRRYRSSAKKLIYTDGVK